MKKLEQLITLRVNNYPISITLNEAWALFIGKFEYCLYCTFTFKHEVSQYKALRQFFRYLRLFINEPLYGNNYRKHGSGVNYVVAIERQRRGVIHLHVLIGGNAWKLKRLMLMHIWHQGATLENGKRFYPNGFAKIEEYNSKLGAKYYIGKYVGKGGEIIIDVPPNMHEYYDIGEGANSLRLFHSSS